MKLRQGIARVVALALLLPAGLVCLGAPFYMLTLPDRGGIIDDTRAALGGGVPAGKLKASQVDCVRERVGGNSSRSIGMTEYACVIDLAEAEEAPAPDDDPWAGRTYAEGMAESARRLNAQMEALSQRARAGTSNRIERKLASDRSGNLPAIRILSADREPRRVGLVWGFGELAGRWLAWLATSLILLAFGAGCLFAVWVAWRRR